jgi:type IV pilus assembly protein PilF
MTHRLALLAALLSVSCVSSARQKQAAAQADLGAAYLREGSLPDAVMALERAVKDDPRNWDAWQKLGLAYGASRAEDRARDAFDKALQIAPKSGEVNANYGAYLMKLGDVDAAIERLEVAKADLTYRNTANVLNNLGVALYAKGTHDRAIAVLTDAVQRAPNQWQARFHRGLAYQAKGDPKLAAADFDAVIQLSKGTMTEAYVRGAESQLALGNAVAACAYLDQVLNGMTRPSDMAPDEVAAYEALVEQAQELSSKSCAGAVRP